MPSGNLPKAHHDRVKRAAAAEDTTIRAILSRLIDEHLDDPGVVVGCCPECGERFWETHVKSSDDGESYVECPNRFESARGEKVRHSGGDGNFNNQFAVDDLDHEPADEEERGDVPEDAGMRERVEAALEATTYAISETRVDAALAVIGAIRMDGRVKSRRAARIVAEHDLSISTPRGWWSRVARELSVVGTHEGSHYYEWKGSE